MKFYQYLELDLTNQEDVKKFFQGQTDFTKAMELDKENPPLWRGFSGNRFL